MARLALMQSVWTDWGAAICDKQAKLQAKRTRLRLFCRNFIKTCCSGAYNGICVRDCYFFAAFLKNNEPYVRAASLHTTASLAIKAFSSLTCFE